MATMTKVGKATDARVTGRSSRGKRKESWTNERSIGQGILGDNSGDDTSKQEQRWKNKQQQKERKKSPQKAAAAKDIGTLSSSDDSDGNSDEDDNKEVGTSYKNGTANTAKAPTSTKNDDGGGKLSATSGNEKVASSNSERTTD
jgi:hypothetical protein